MTAAAVPIDRILRALRAAPDGMTTQQIAERFAMRPNTVSSRLSKLFLYGTLERARPARQRHATGYVWRMPV